MTKTIIRVVGAAIVTMGVGAGTAYKIVKKPAPTAAEMSTDKATVETRESGVSVTTERGSVQITGQGKHDRVKVGSVDIGDDGGDQDKAKAGNVTAKRDGQKQAVTVGNGVSVEQDGQKQKVKVGGTEIEQDGKKGRVQVGGIVVDEDGFSK